MNEESDYPEIKMLPSPEEILAEQLALKESALAKLTKLGLTIEEAKAVIGIG